MSNTNVIIDRHKYVGGSDLPNILGFNLKYGKRIFDFAKEKAGIIPNDFKGNQFTKYGQIMEPIIRDYINSTQGTNFKEDTTIDKDRGYRGNTDGIDKDIPLLLEIKTHGENLDIDYYNPQCQFYMETFNVDSCLLVGYQRPEDFYSGVDYELENTENYFNCEFDENRVSIHTIQRDKTLWAKIEAQINRFKIVVTKLKKKPDMTELEFNKMFYGTDLIKKSNEVAKLENSLLKFKVIEKKHKEVKDQLYDMFNERGINSFDTGVIKITKVAPTSYDTVSIDTAKLKEENETIYNKYKVTKTTNKKGYILITTKKEDK